MGKLRDIFALLIAVAFSTAMARTDSFEPMALVNDQIITQFDVSQRARQLAVEAGGKEGTYRVQALEELITETIFRQEALAAGHSVSDSAIEKRLTVTWPVLKVYPWTR